MDLSTHYRRFRALFLFLAVLVAVGTVGYMIVERWTFTDAFYMTVITVTAVGYSEVHPLTEAGRTFTVLILAGGITFLGVWFALITSLIVELDLTDVLRRRRIVKSIDRTKDHVIVCGVGHTGRQVVHELAESGVDWVAIERDPDRIEWMHAQFPDALVLHGDATDDEILRSAGLERASGLVACLSADTDNLFVCLSARDLAPELTIVVRAYEEATTEKLYRAGATHVVSPNVSGAVRMASVLIRPSVVSFLDVATRSSNLNLRMEQLTVPSSGPITGKTLMEARIPQQTGLIVIATREAGADEHGFVFNPSAETRLDPGDEMIVLGTPEQIDRLRSYVT